MKPRGTKVEASSIVKIGTSLQKSFQSWPSKNSRKWRGGVTAELTDITFGIRKLCDLPGFDISELTASLLSFPGGPAGLASSSVLLGARKATRSQCFHGRNLMYGGGLKVRPIE